jgi:hypothetical protein
VQSSPGDSFAAGRSKSAPSSDAHPIEAVTTSAGIRGHELDGGSISCLFVDARHRCASRVFKSSFRSFQLGRSKDDVSLFALVLRGESETIARLQKRAAR